VRLYPGGKAVSTVGTSGVASASDTRLSSSELRELGSEGLSHASWQPGQSRGSVHFNFGPAVKLSGSTAQVVGLYSFTPAQAELKRYTATLLSNGLAFNDIDTKSGGVWRLDCSTVIINWISGWRTTMSLDPATPLRLRI